MAAHSSRTPPPDLARVSRDDKSLKPLKFVHYDPKLKRKALHCTADKVHDAQGSPIAGQVEVSPSPPTPLVIPRSPGTRSGVPFFSPAVLYISKDERLMLNYAYKRMWPVWGSQHGQSWMKGSSESSAIFHGQIFAAASHYLVNCRNDSAVSEAFVSLRLRSKALVIQGLREEIERYHLSQKKTSADRLLMPMASLAMNDNIDLSGEDPIVSMTPMSLIRDFQIYGRMEMGEEHLGVFFHLIEQTGGLHAVDKGAFGIVAPLMDLVHAARKQRPPSLPCHWELKPLEKPGVWEPDARARQLLQVSGSHFRCQLNDRSFPLDLTLCTILLNLVEVSVAIDHMQRSGIEVLRKPRVWIDNSNFACHSLLSMSPIAFSEDYEHDNSCPRERRRLGAIVSEVCRKAACIYAGLVILPPRVQPKGIRHDQASVLYEDLELMRKEAPSEIWVDLSGVARWAAILGALVTGSDTQRDRYTRFIAQICTPSSSMEWENVESSLHQFLWLQHALQDPARAIWQEVETLSHRLAANGAIS